jgi:hypothetical protein
MNTALYESALSPNQARLIQNTGPTPERVAKSDGGDIVDGARVFRDEVLQRLFDRGQLWPDKAGNEALYMAGTKYYEDWYGSGMGGLQAIDYGKVSGGQGGAGSAMPASRLAAQARANYRAARAAMPARYRKATELFLLEGQTDVVAVGKAITGAASTHANRAVALERFITGLYLLAKHYVFLA